MKKNNVISITNIYRKTLMEYLKKNISCTDYEEVIDKFLFTSLYNEDFINKNKFINNNDLLAYKKIITKLILTDNYVLIKSEICDKEEDKYVNEMSKYSCMDNNDIDNSLIEFEKEEEEIKQKNTKIIDFIEYCIDRKIIGLPKDVDLRYLIYENFIDYNVYEFDKTYDYELLNQYGYTKTLKKINPCFIIDCIDTKE